MAAEDGIWDSWEDFADSNDLDKHVSEYLKLSNGVVGDEEGTPTVFEQNEPVNSCENGSKTQFRILQRPVVHEEDQNRTAYIPQVKILRRPGKEHQNTEGDKGNEKSGKTQPARTLAEREAAYAEARKRIMGSDSVAQSNSGLSVSTKLRSEHRKTRSTKSPENPAVTIERLPKGPDKTKGFSTPR